MSTTKKARPKRPHPQVNKKTPLRRCVGCREMKDKKSLIRITTTPDGVQIDPTGKANGRGAYICNGSIECLKKAEQSKGLERSLKRAIPQEIYNDVAQI